jgi:hypothetical protein
LICNRQQQRNVVENVVEGALLQPQLAFARVQHLATDCVFLRMLESCMDYAEVYTVNSKGILQPQLAFAAACVAAMFHECTRVLILLLAGGIAAGGSSHRRLVPLLRAPQNSDAWCAQPACTV